MLATLVFGMSLRDSALVILFFALVTCIPPAFMATGGANTGLRQQVQARYSFGLYLVTIPLLLNAATVTGFSLISAIVGGQAIASLNSSHVSVNVGIVIVSLVSFAASFMGYKALHFWERWTWIPSLISLVIAVGCGGKHLHLQSVVPPSTPSQVLSYGGLIAGYFLTFGGTVSDYSVYHDPRHASKYVSLLIPPSLSQPSNLPPHLTPNHVRLKIFTYTYLGFFLPSVPLLILGAAIGGAVPQVPAWEAAYAVSGVGGVFREMLRPAGGFGCFVVVLLALSVVGNVAISMYSVALNLQMLFPPLARVPRFVFTVAVFAVMIPLAVAAAARWEESVENFLALIGYYAGCFDAVLLVELIVFRRLRFETYDHAVWNVGRKLPSGLAAVGASVASFGLVVPGMAENWYTGPIAEKTGDIGFEFAFVVTALLYVPLRWLEIRIRGHL